MTLEYDLTILDGPPDIKIISAIRPKEIIVNPHRSTMIAVTDMGLSRLWPVRIQSPVI